MEAQSPQSQQAPQMNLKDKLLADNNKRAYELLLRIQSQLEASRVIATSTAKVSNYE